MLDRFRADPDLFAVPVIDEFEIPVALLDRKAFMEFAARPFWYEVFGRRHVEDLLLHEVYEDHLRPIIVEESQTVDDVAEVILGEGVQYMVTGFIVTHANGVYLGIANGHDLLKVITQRKQSELFYLAHYDSLTQIPNRALLADRLEHACKDARRRGHQVGLLFIDLDGFKKINDSLGHRIGDEVLRQIAQRLTDASRASDTVARLGGDEFVILMEHLTSTEAVAGVADRVLQSLQLPLRAHGHSLVVTASIGSAIYPQDEADISALLAKADAAMYEAKQRGKNAYQKYSPSLTPYDPTRFLLENELREALAADQLELHLQPQLDLTTGVVLGAEALVRWMHPVKGMLSPGRFIPIAESCGLITQIGQWVLRQTLQHIQVFQALQLPPLPISVNISAIQFRQQDFAETLQLLLREFAIEPTYLELELTESVLMQSADEVLQVLEDIKHLGIKLSIDDFGTGFSSLSYLRRFPIDALKIDQSFVRDIDRLTANASIAKAIIALAQSLSLEVIAEGVETENEREILRRIGCPAAQGYLFAKPMPATEFPAWLLAHSSAPVGRKYASVNAE